MNFKQKPGRLPLSGSRYPPPPGMLRRYCNVLAKQYMVLRQLDKIGYLSGGAFT